MEDKTQLLLSLQEHPENYTDEQLRQMFVEDKELAEQFEQLALTKQAFARREAEEAPAPVDEEWRKFCKEMFAEEAPATGEKHVRTWMKVAAGFIGVLLVTGMTFAAIRWWKDSYRRQAKEQAETIQTTDTVVIASKQSATIISVKAEEDSIIVFDNVPLEKMMPEIAAYYQKKVEFQNAEARMLRFYFVWKRTDSIEVVLHRLNLFESIHAELKENIIVVE